MTSPASITVAAGAATGSFTATAGTVSTDQTTVITASYGGASRTSSIALTSQPAQISALSCTPASLGSGQVTTCTVTLTKAAPAGGAVVAVSDDNANLTSPASITVAAGAATGSFTATAGTIASDQTATVTASLNGGSKSAAISLNAASTVLSIWTPTSVPAVPSVSDNASVELGLKFRSDVAGFVTGVRFYKGSRNSGTHVGSLWSNTGGRLASVTFTGESNSGWQQALFSTPVSILANTTYVVSYFAPKGRNAANIGYFTADVVNGPLRALKDGGDGANSVYLYGANGGFPNATFQSSNYWVDVVFTPQQPTLLSAAPSEPKTLALAKLSSTQAVANRHSSPPALSCLPRTVRAGDSFNCVLRLDEDRSAGTDAIAVTATGTDVRLPVRITARAGQRGIAFHGSVDKAASQSLVLIGAGEGEAYAEDQIAILPAGVPVLSVPGVLYARPGDPIAFTIGARDGGDLPVTIGASDLPSGATFDAASKHFAWTPSNKEGEYLLTFTAVNQAGASSTEQTRIIVASGKPQVTGPSGLACVPGSIATLQGRWLSLADQLLFDWTGSSLELGGTAVRVNGSPAPILSVSPARVDFLCPNNPSGQEMNLVLETAMGVSAPLPVAFAEAKPVLLSVEGAETEGLVTMAGTDRLTVLRDVRGAGEPAQVGDLVVVRATGLGALAAEIGSMAIKIGDVEARIESVKPDPATAGAVQILVRVPVTVGGGDAIPVRMTLRSTTGQTLAGNIVTMAIE